MTESAIRQHRILAALGLLAFLAHAWLKMKEGLLPELLWGCNLSALALIFAFAFEWPLVVGAAFLWRLGLGEPGFIAGVWTGERYAWTSGLVHLVPTALAFLFLRRSGLPRGSALAAFGFCLFLVPLGRWFTPPELNVNFAFIRVPWLAQIFPGLWTYRFGAVLLTTITLWSLDTLFTSWLGRLRPTG